MCNKYLNLKNIAHKPGKCNVFRKETWERGSDMKRPVSTAFIKWSISIAALAHNKKSAGVYLLYNV